ncbi:MAG: DNA mismatch repair endonuclease MutL [Lentisphaerae bacterium]|nr:DNA mismatch repair endonuclease MutL [Lentisphaerota bacterium]
MAAIQHIRLLPIHVANKIAAGEVVERPASVVKELMENALDAGATRIEVTVTAGGRRLIAVADDGSGMGRDDALMSIEAQATSKIRDVDDIERIHTYGFRGEALPSIGAVSRVTMRTCLRGEPAGTELTVVGGRLQDVRDIGFPAGTTVEVRDLFFNVPARRKFLRAYQTEQAHIRTTFLLQALSHPEAGLRLKADGRDLHNLPPGATLAERVTDLFGADFMAALRPVDLAARGVRVSGFAGLPTFTRADRAEQYLFVNRRAASAAVIPYALREAYPPLEGDRKPIVILFIDVAPEAVDVNVHPTKREVRFREAGDVRDAVIAAVSAALGTTPRPRPSTPSTPSADPLAGAVPPPPPAPPRASPRVDLPAFAASPLFGGAPGEAPFSTPAARPGESVPETGAPPGAERLPAAAGSEAPWAWCRVLGQVAGLYVLLETDGGYVVLDPRAAHERVLYERLMTPVREGHPVAAQRLLLPDTVQLPPEDADRLRKHLAVLRTMGFELDDFGDNRVIVEALPAGLGVVDSRGLLADLAHDILAAGARRSGERWREEAIAAAACRAAVRNSGPLKAAEIAALVRDLAATRMPYTCPRGRPTMIFTPLRELARKFGRD